MWGDMTDYTKLEQEVDAVADTIWDVASNVWEFAELGYKEFKSSAYVSEALEKYGFTLSDQGAGGLGTSWVATWGTGSPVLGILVEFDALPGLGNDTVPQQAPAKSGNPNGHGCGHNLIASTSMGAAIALKNHMEKEDITGTLRVFGCPAEELLNGKNYMAAAGVFDGVDVCLHNHPGMVNTVWNFHSAAAVDLWVEWQGITAHAGVAPWEGRSALHAAEIFLVAANMMREQMLPTARLHYQILDGGQAVNVVPDYAKVLIRYRGPSAENVMKHKAWIEDIAKGAALCTQTKATVTNLGGIYDCLPNDVLAERMTEQMNRYFPVVWTDEEQAFAKSIQKEMGQPEDGLATTVMPVPTGVNIGGSSDVGDVSWQIPTMGAVYSSWPLNIPPHQWGCTACHGMSIGRKATHQAAKVLATTGLDLLTEPDLLKAVKDDFVKQLNGRSYKTLNDSETNPAGELDAAELHQYDCCIHAAIEHFGVAEHAGAPV
jgi:aminobenzoyl-glutamate utilization protein B